MVLKFQRFQLAFGSVVEQPIDCGSTWIWVIVWGGCFFFWWSCFFGIFSPGKTTFNYSGPPKQWVPVD